MCKNCNSVVVNAENNIRVALQDYFRHVSGSELSASDFSGRFVSILAEKSTAAKHDLREIFKKSQSYDEKLDAIVISSKRTAEPDRFIIYELLSKLLENTPYDSYFLSHFLQIDLVRIKSN